MPSCTISLWIKVDGEAFDIAKNTPQHNGAEAWGRSCKRFGGRTIGKRLNLTRRCVNPKKVKKLSETMSSH